MRVRWNGWSGGFVGALVGAYLGVICGDHSDGRFTVGDAIALALGTLFGMAVGWCGGVAWKEIYGGKPK